MNRTIFCHVALAALAISLLLLPRTTLAEPGCSESATLLRVACGYDLRDDFYTQKAQCLDNTVVDDSCVDDAAAEFDEGLEECVDINAARLELCDALENATHEPQFGADFAADFVNPLDIGNGVVPANPWFPLVVGNHWVYAGDGEEIDVIVLAETKLIDGITCIVVVDTASEDDVVVEITRDWFAQDTDGNVWYCGEISENFEEFDGDDTSGPELVDIDGSWKAGRDGSEAGILLPFSPEPGTLFRQEYAQSEAEDVVEVLATDASETSPFVSCDSNCLLTRDFTPLEPDAEENKYYAPGVGLIVEVKPGTDERVELVEFSGAGS